MWNKKNKEEVELQHRDFLTVVYNMELEKPDRPFSKAVFTAALDKLENGVEPLRVENWTERLMKDFRKI